MQVTGTLECYEQGLLDDSNNSSQKWNDNRKVDSKTCAHGFQMRIRTLLGLETMLYPGKESGCILPASHLSE